MKLLRIIIVSALLISTVVIGVVYAADGSGTNTVSPTSTSAGSTGGTYTFTYTATEAMNSGAITLTIPSGWTAPQGTAGTPGYTTVASTGTVGNVLDNADSLTGWARRTTNPTACSGGLTVDTAVKQEGTGSIKCVNSSDKNNGVWYKNITAQNWSAYTRVGFWIRLNSPINNGDLQFAYDNNNNLASPIAELSFGNSIPADTWTYVSFNLTGTRTSVASFGMKIANLSAMGNTTVWVDNFLLGASSGITPVFSGNTIIINALNLTAGQTITITYGSGGGTSGVTAPSTGGVYTFTTQSKISAGGALTNISSSPTVTVTPVGNPVPAINSISPTSKIIGSSEFSMTIDGSNFISSSVVRFNGSDRVTTYVSASQLTAVIPASDLTSTGAFNITVFNPTPGGGTSNTKIFTVEPKPAVKFVIIDPADATAGDTITVTVQAQNEDGAVVATYQNDVRLVASGSATGAGLVAITNGVGTKDITDTVAETVNLSLEDSEATGLDISSTQNVIFSPGAVVQLNITNPGDTTAGTRLAYTVTREDIYGNLVTTGSTTVYLYTNSTGGLGKFYDAASGGNQIMSVDISGGSSAGFWYEEGRAGSWTVTVSDSASAPDGTTGIDDASDGVTVAAAATSKFVLNNPGDMTAGTRLAYTVTRYDAFDNLSVSGSDTVYLYSSSTGSDAFYDSASGGSQITSVAISSGSSANFWYSDDTAGSWTITASDNASAPDGNTGIDDGTDPVQVSDAPITATKIEISDPADGTVGDNILVTVRALDDSNNLDTDYSGSVTLITSGSATGGGAVTISGGVGTATITDTVAEIVNLTLTDSGGTGLNVSSTQNVAFAAGPVSQISITDAGNGSAGTRLAYTITRKDQYGNLVTAGSTTIYLYTNSTGASGKFYDAASGGSQIASVTIGASSSSADFWYEETSSGSWTVTASDNNSTPDGATGIADASDGVTISPAPLAKFVLNDPGDMTAGNRLGYVVTRYDAFDNPVTSDSTTVYLYSNSTGTTKAFYTVASGGDPVVSISIPAGTSFNNFWYYDDLAGTFTITSSDNSSAPDGDAGVDDGTDSLIVSLLPITATKLVIQDPADGEVGDVIQVTIRAVNDSGDLDTSYNNAVTLNTTGSATGGGACQHCKRDRRSQHHR